MRPLLSAETVTAIVHVMSGMYRAAMKEHPPVVMANPFAELDLPVIEPRSVDFCEPDEAAALYAAAGEIGAKWQAIIELGMQVGLRMGSCPGCTGTGWTGSAAGLRSSTS